MKLTAIIIVTACMHVSAHSYSQTVSFRGKNVPLQAVFASIEKQTGLSFFFNYALIKDIKPVTLEVQDVPMEAALHQVLSGQGLDFYQSGKTVFIVKAQSPTEKPVIGSLGPGTDKQVDLKGRVTDMQGLVLVGASVTVKKMNKGTMTDEKGMFEMKNVPLGSVLEVSYAGYQMRMIEVDGNAWVSVQLTISTSQLDETQVIAYGQTNQRMSVGDVTSIKAADIEKQPVSNPLLALEGRVPGMFITQSNGLSSSGVKVQIRGQNNIVYTSNTGNDPLYVIDGVPYTSQLLPGVNLMLGSSGSPNSYVVGSPLNFINPSDIESISVLKDADATAIYGSRAANGAILITTKKGKSGNTTVNLNVQNGWGQVGHKLDMMNTLEYLQMRHEAITNDGLSVGPYDYDLNGTWDSTQYTDWQKVLIGRTAQYNDINGSVTGGNSHLQYVIGGTFHRETTVFSNDFSDQKGAVHFSIKNISTNQKFQIQLTGNYLIDDNQLPNSDLTATSLLLAPNAPFLYAKNGQLNWAPDNSGNSTFFNPLGEFLNRYKNKTNNLIAISIVSYLILPGLNLSTSLGYTNLQSNEMSIYPLTSTPPELRAYSIRAAIFGNNNINSWIVEPQLTYKHRFGKAAIDALAGLTINQNNSNGLQIAGGGQTSDQVLADIRSATALSVLSSTYSVYKYNAGFGRIGFNWDEKYLVSLSLRRDGSSRFGPANQFHNFGAIGAGWVFSNESFMKKQIPWMSFGKIRASYGTTGSDQIGDYQFMNLYTLRSYSVPYQNSGSLVATGLTNPYLQWQETKKLEVGTDLGFFKDRVLLNVNYFRNRSSNQLLGYPLPIITGFGGITKNLPATVQNKGWEFLFNSINIRTKNFSWSTSINLSTSDNKLISFPGYTGTVYIVGQPLVFAHLYHYLGVNPATGLYQFSDGKGGASSRPDTNQLVSRTKTLRTTPFYFGGFSNTLRFKGVQLDFLFQFVKQNGPSYLYGAFMPGGISVNQPKWLSNRWKNAGDVAEFQKYTSVYNPSATWNDVISSDATYKDASYIRLKNISLSWQIPAQWIKSSHIQSIRIYTQAQNLLTITKYKGLDPETLSSTTLPPLRVITVGIQAVL